MTGVPGSDLSSKLMAAFTALGDIAYSYPFALILLEIEVYTQAAFGTAERWFAEKFPASWLLDDSYSIKLPLLSTLRTNYFRLSFRTVYVASATGTSIFFPYFNSVLGVLGSVFFWPLVIYFPVEMYSVQMRIQAWSREWILLRAFSFLGLAITVLGTIGSLEELVSAKIS
ncbi:hypothetical protein SAY86_016264 [Trapa natans]|uniref:Amino acid transporter transmembrane domain-containing protein n=1 Tax=Trapa natans TaxID=22666 RepID=A0AAN7QX00_TRANT|nr:hypothetical protein SAY86_016264 [Trapa natans]